MLLGSRFLFGNLRSYLHLEILETHHSGLRQTHVPEIAGSSPTNQGLVSGNWEWGLGIYALNDFASWFIEKNWLVDKCIGFFYRGKYPKSCIFKLSKGLFRMAYSFFLWNFVNHNNSMPTNNILNNNNIGIYINNK